jgi:predicted nuclease with TOPRIM domain
MGAGLLIKLGAVGALLAAILLTASTLIKKGEQLTELRWQNAELVRELTRFEGELAELRGYVDSCNFEVERLETAGDLWEARYSELVNRPPRVDVREVIREVPVAIASEDCATGAAELHAFVADLVEEVVR